MMPDPVRGAHGAARPRNPLLHAAAPLLRALAAIQCAQEPPATLGNRFPLRRDGADADLEDFRAFFAPGGAADSYFRSVLQPWVDTSRRPWRYRSAPAAEAPEASPGPASSGESSPATGPVARELLDLLRKRGPDPEAFARVAQVRKALWRNGAGPQWDFDLIEAALRAAIERFEPRILAGSVEITALQETGVARHNVLSFQIRGLIRDLPRALPFAVRSTIDLETRRVWLEERQGAHPHGPDAEQG